MNIIKHIPNGITCLNLLCGCIGILQAFEGNLQHSASLIFLACVLDFFDGFVARILKAHSPIGKELDSLADVVTFGVLPGVILYKLSMNQYVPESLLLKNVVPWHVYFVLMVPVFSALRLAKFNVDTRQSDSFIGLPTPANAMLIASLPFIYESCAISTDWQTVFQYLPSVLAVVMSLLLVAEIPLLALKFKNISWRDNKYRYLLVMVSLILFLFFQINAIPFIIFFYIILSLLGRQSATQLKGL